MSVGGLHDGVHAVVQGEDEAGGEGAGLRPGVHEGGGVGQELHAGHGPVELLLSSRDLVVGGAVGAVGGGDGAGDAAEEALHGFDEVPLVVLEQVAVLEDDAGVVRNLGAAVGRRWSGETRRGQGRHDTARGRWVRAIRLGNWRRLSQVSQGLEQGLPDARVRGVREHLTQAADGLLPIDGLLALCGHLQTPS